MRDVGFGFFSGIALTLLVASCVTDNQYPWEHHAAEVVCMKNGGYKVVRYTNLFSFGNGAFNIVCNDGASFQYSYGRLESIYKNSQKEVLTPESN